MTLINQRTDTEGIVDRVTDHVLFTRYLRIVTYLLRLLSCIVLLFTGEQ